MKHLAAEIKLVRSPANHRGGRVVRWCWIKLPLPRRPTIWITVGQGPTALAVGAGGEFWTFLL